MPLHPASLDTFPVPLAAIVSDWQPVGTQLMVVPDVDPDEIKDDTGNTLLVLPENRYKQLPRGRVYRKGPQTAAFWQEGDVVFWLRNSEQLVMDDASGQAFAIVPEGQILLRKPVQSACL